MRTKSRTKGMFVFGLAFFMIVGLIVVVSVFLFFIFFKVHITSIAVDVDSINRYQEVPTTLLGASVRAKTVSESSVNIEDACKGENPWAPPPHCTELAKIFRNLKAGLQQPSGNKNCFNGNGPAGPHAPNDGLCTKRLAFYQTKFLNGKGDPIFSSEAKANIGVSPDLLSLVANIRSALPTTCYRISFSTQGDASKCDDEDINAGIKCDKLESGSELTDCDLEKFPRLKEDYPIPTFSNGVPTIAAQTLAIGRSTSAGQEIFVSWPRYDTCFSGQSGCGDRESGAARPAADKPPEIKVSHTPLAPTPTETISVDAVVSDDIRLKSVEIFFDGKSLGTCHYVGVKTSTCTRSAASYPEGTSHEYYAKVTDSGDQIFVSDKNSFAIKPGVGS